MEIRSLQDADVAPAFALATQVFVEHGTLHRALGADLQTYRAYLWPEFQAMVDERLSVCAVDPSGEMLGCLIAIDFHGPLHAAPGRHPVFAPVSALMSALGDAYKATVRDLAWRGYSGRYGGGCAGCDGIRNLSGDA